MADLSNSWIHCKSCAQERKRSEKLKNCSWIATRFSSTLVIPAGIDPPILHLRFRIHNAVFFLVRVISELLFPFPLDFASSIVIESPLCRERGSCTHEYCRPRWPTRGEKRVLTFADQKFIEMETFRASEAKSELFWLEGFSDGQDVDSDPESDNEKSCSVSEDNMLTPLWVLGLVFSKLVVFLFGLVAMWRGWSLSCSCLYLCLALLSWRLSSRNGWNLCPFSWLASFVCVFGWCSFSLTWPIILLRLRC